MKTINIRLKWLTLLFFLLGITTIINSCSDSVVDPETAVVLIGDGDDTINLPTLEKGLVKIGYSGKNGNLFAQDFVPFRNITRYRVDTSNTGKLISLSNVKIEAKFVDRDKPWTVNPFAPVTRVVIALPMLRVNGFVSSSVVDLVVDPFKSNDIEPGIRIEVEVEGRNIVFSPDPYHEKHGWGTAVIASVDYVEHRINLSIRADLTHTSTDVSPNRIVFESLLELPF